MKHSQSTVEHSGGVLVLDFGAQYAQLIARRVRECNIYSHIVPHAITVEEIKQYAPSALILSGGPASVYAPDAKALDERIFSLGLPVLGICYGFQVMAQSLGGRVERTDKQEYGATEVFVEEESGLFQGQPSSQTVWMSHGDAVFDVPEGFRVFARSDGAPVAAFGDVERKLYGVQWHPEVQHSVFGQATLEHFLVSIANIPQTWTSEHIISDRIEAITQQVGSNTVVCGLSGGVDSAVAAALTHRAIGDQLVCIFVDHGLLRQAEAEQVERDYVEATGIRLIRVDARERFLQALKGVSDPEQKRTIIGHQFIEAFDAAQAQLVAEKKDSEPVKFLVQGTLYPDVVESGGEGGAAAIKSHHNVGGLPEDLQFDLVEPLRTLFKDEVRVLGRELGLPEAIVQRHPFPGPGLGIRIVGEVTSERLELLRAADAIVREETTRTGLDDKIWQFPVVLLADVRSVGVMGDGRTYGHPIVLRPVSSEDAMTATMTRLPWELIERISTRITNEVDGVNRVVLDVTSKPPATIEWE